MATDNMAVNAAAATDTGANGASDSWKRYDLHEGIKRFCDAMKKGEDTANALMIGAINNLFASLGVDLSKVTKVAVCGNPFQLSLFQNIEIRDLAYAGKKKLERLGVVSPPRNDPIATNSITTAMTDISDDGVSSSLSSFFTRFHRWLLILSPPSGRCLPDSLR